ncbi:hypothetical protein [Streptomyces sp. NBC_01262]|uniref:hypothetical protein n=1 Tax=Streptomyces sp. NBC_01262 TaxID=2903803 RepID=UPI002E34A8B9|nr:hypothetical protein [Streptomyces sp. NBC_01262]
MTMKDFIGRHHVMTPSDLLELALGTPLDLWLGEDGENEEERAAREAAARDILADDPALADRTLRVAAQAIEAHMPELFRITPPPSAVRRRAARTGVAA